MSIDNLPRYIRELDDQDRLYKFYKSREWLELRDQVLKSARYECARCAEVGRYSRATMVHHVNEVRLHPELALSRYYVDQEGVQRPNLLPLCAICHEREHKRFALGGADSRSIAPRFTTPERW